MLTTAGMVLISPSSPHFLVLWNDCPSSYDWCLRITESGWLGVIGQFLLRTGSGSPVLLIMSRLETEINVY